MRGNQPVSPPLTEADEELSVFLAEGISKQGLLFIIYYLLFIIYKLFFFSFELSLDGPYNGWITRRHKWEAEKRAI
jgi:hypothetical protein